MSHCEAHAPRRILNILLVEDDDIDARVIGMVADLVENFELDVTRVNSIHDAKSAIAANRFDVCLLDFWLGRESSLRFLSALEEMDTRMGTVVLSNISLQEATNFRLGTQRNFFLPKAECTPDQLSSAIGAVAPRES